jgi:hypothetical protein
MRIVKIDSLLLVEKSCEIPRCEQYRAVRNSDTIPSIVTTVSVRKNWFVIPSNRLCQSWFSIELRICQICDEGMKRTLRVLGLWKTSSE